MKKILLVGCVCLSIVAKPQLNVGSSWRDFSKPLQISNDDKTQNTSYGYSSHASIFSDKHIIINGDARISTNLKDLMLVPCIESTIPSHTYLSEKYKSTVGGISASMSGLTFATINSLEFLGPNSSSLIGEIKPLVLERGSLGIQFSNYISSPISISAFSIIQDIPVLLNSSSNSKVLETQIDISRQTFYRSDNSLWSEQFATEGIVGSTSFVLHTSSSANPENKNGGFIISHGNGNDFSVKTDNSGGYIGWKDVAGSVLTLSASITNTEGQLNVGGVISSRTGVAVTDVYGVEISKTENIQGLFSSTSKQSGILIENQSNKNDAMSAIWLRQGEITNYIGTTSINSTSNFLSVGTFLMESRSPNGILFNVAMDNSGHWGSIKFAINSNEVARFGESGAFLLGTIQEYRSSIFTISSISKGVLLPRMTSEERLAIVNPDEGLEVYDTDLHKKCLFTGTNWEELCSQTIREL